MTAIRRCTYWHIYAGEMAEDMFLSFVAGPTENAIPLEEVIEGVPWVQTLNHKPTQQEIDQHTPQEWK